MLLLVEAYVLAATDFTTAGVIVALITSVLGVVKAASLLGPDRTAKLMENFKEALLASQGETVIWERRALAAEKRVQELEQQIADQTGGTP